MRTSTIMAVLMGFCLTATALQPPAGPDGLAPDRFGVPHRPKNFPQATPKDTLASVIEVVAAGRTDYLLAHLMDPGFVDDRVANRARVLAPAVELDLLRLRDSQRASPVAVPDAERVPDDPLAFQAMALQTANTRAVQQVTADVRTHLGSDPEVLRELRRFFREGTFEDGDTSARVTLPDVKGRAVYFKKLGERWFMENRQVDEKTPAAP